MTTPDRGMAVSSSIIPVLEILVNAEEFPHQCSAKEYWDDEEDEVVEEVGVIMSSLGDKRISDKSHKKKIL